MFDELFTLARKASGKDLEAKFLEAFTAAPERIDEWLRIAEEMKTTGKRTQAGNLLAHTIDHYEKSGNAEHRVKVLSFVAGALEKDRNHRASLARALQDLHHDKPAFELFLDACGLRGDATVDAALASLARMFDYDVGHYVLHAAGWGIGLIDGIDSIARELTILFEAGRRHSMPVTSAVQTLQPLVDSDWRVLKHFKLDELRELCEQEPGEVISRMLQQMNRPADVATVRSYLEGSVIPAAQWGKWWSSARKAALGRPDIEVQGNRIVWRRVSSADRLGAMRKVLSAKQVLDLANTLLKSMAERGTVDPKLMTDLYPVLFEGAAKHAATDESAPLELLLLADDIATAYQLNRVALDERLAAHLRDESTFFTRLSDLGNARLEKRALDHFHAFCGATYPDRLLALAHVASARLLDLIVPELLDAGRAVDLRLLLNEAMRKAEVQPEMLVFARRRIGQPRFAALFEGLEPRSLVDRCLAMGEGQGRQPNLRLRALQRQVAKELTDNNGREFRTLVKSLTLDNARLLMRRVEMLRGLTDHTMVIMFTVFGEVHPELAKKEEIAAAHLDERVIWCTEEGIKKRNAEYEQVINVELPKIFAAVGRAAAFGDLSENAEYTAALEDRARLTQRAEEMVEELRRAKVIDGSLLEDGLVTVGAAVKVRDVATGKERTFALLGPWDADLEKGYLDYRAPFAKAFFAHGPGETVTTEIGGKPVQFEILEVKPAVTQ